MNRTLIIEKMIDDKWLSRRKFAEHVGIPPTTLQSILKRGVGNASIDNIIKICKGLGITVDQLEEMSKNENILIKESSANYHNIKTLINEYNYFPTAISAGLPIEVDGITKNDVEKLMIPDHIMGKWAGHKDIFITKISGDSMNNLMDDGTLIAVKPTPLESLKNGDIVVFSDGYDYSVKHYHKYGDTLVFTPNSTNNAHKEQTFSSNDNLTIHGKVVIHVIVHE